MVDGFITTEPGPHTINLTRLSQFTGVMGIIPVENDAEVYIMDNEGIRTDLRQMNTIRKENFNEPAAGGGTPTLCNPRTLFFEVKTPGYLTPEGFRGEVGKTYTLFVRTSAGEEFVSTPQTIIPTPEIDSISFEYERLPSSDPVTFESGVGVSVTWQDPVETENFYSWQVNGIYRLETPDRPEICCVYDVFDGGSELCWIHEKDLPGNLVALSDTRFNGSRDTRRVGFVLDDGLRFASQEVGGDRQYYVEVLQYGLSGEAFAFNRLLNSQLEIDGDIFDPPPANIMGNMSRVGDPDELVLGFFGAYSVQTASRFIKRSILEEIKPSTRPCGDCRTRRGARVEVPEPFR